MHLGRDGATQLVNRFFLGTGFQDTRRQITSTCEVHQNNLLSRRVAWTGVQRTGTFPGEDGQIDFTHTSKVKGVQYLLVRVDTSRGWIEAFPCRAAKATKVAGTTVNETISWFGLPRSLQSDNGPAFEATVTQGVSSALGVQYDFQCSWRPQSSGKVERANGITK